MTTTDLWHDYGRARAEQDDAVPDSFRWTWSQRDGPGPEASATSPARPWPTSAPAPPATPPTWPCTTPRTGSTPWTPHPHSTAWPPPCTPRELLPAAAFALRPGGRLVFSTLAHYLSGAPARPDVTEPAATFLITAAHLPR